MNNKTKKIEIHTHSFDFEFTKQKKNSTNRKHVKHGKCSKLEALTDIAEIFCDYANEPSDLFEQQIFAKINSFAYRWNWDISSVKQFLSECEKKGILVMAMTEHNVAIGFTDAAVISLFIRLNDDMSEYLIAEFIRFIDGSLNAEFLTELYQRYYSNKISLAAQSPNPERSIVKCYINQAVLFTIMMLYVSPKNMINGVLQMYISMGALKLFGNSEVWDWNRVLIILQLMHKSFQQSLSPSKLGKTEIKLSPEELKELDIIYDVFFVSRKNTAA